MILHNIQGVRKFDFLALHKLLFLMILRFHNFQQFLTMCSLFAHQKGRVRKFLFCETRQVNHDYFIVYTIITFPNSIVFGILMSYILGDVHKTQGHPMPFSPILFQPQDLPPAFPYDTLFHYLPAMAQVVGRTGRRPISRNGLLRAFIYKNLRRLSSLSDLVFEINNNPGISPVLGFNPVNAAPSIERFSSFLRHTPNPVFQKIRQELVCELIDAKVIRAKAVAIDSCPIMVHLKENNLKTSVSDRFDKTRIPDGDSDVRLGIIIHYPAPFKKQLRYFWGYRNHVVNDIDTELPLAEKTLPANVHEITIAQSLLREVKKLYHLPIRWVVGDANYDSEAFLDYIIHHLSASPVIPHNPRGESGDYAIRGNEVICQAGLAMYRKGKMRPKKTGILYCQYTCPIIYNKTVRRQYITCPVFHPKFFTGKGCNALIRLEPTIRSQIEYGTEKFKKLYHSRSSIERVFSRLLSLAMQDPTVKGMQAIENHATIAHITALLVELGAHKTGHTDKIRFVKSFVPNFMTQSKN